MSRTDAGSTLSRPTLAFARTSRTHFRSTRPTTPRALVYCCGRGAPVWDPIADAVVSVSAVSLRASVFNTRRPRRLSARSRVARFGDNFLAYQAKKENYIHLLSCFLSFCRACLKRRRSSRSARENNPAKLLLDEKQEKGAFFSSSAVRALDTDNTSSQKRVVAVTSALTTTVRRWFHWCSCGRFFG